MGYLGKYEIIFKKDDPVNLIKKIPNYSKLAFEVFSSEMIEEKYKNIFFNNHDGGNDGGFGNMVFSNEFNHNLNLGEETLELELEAELKW